MAVFSSSNQHAAAAAKQAKRVGDTAFIASLRLPKTKQPPARLELYLHAYIALDTEREFYSEIPWTAIKRYCGHYGFNDFQTEMAFELIRRADSEIIAKRVKDARNRQNRENGRSSEVGKSNVRARK